MKNLSAYIVITHYYNPIRGTTDVQVNEMVEFVDRLKNKHLDSATAIIDFLNCKIVKNRAVTTDYNSYIDYLKDKYPSEMRKLTEIVNLTNAAKQQNTEATQ